MATNPMQKKARNAFLLGIVVMLIIVAAIGAAVYLLIIVPQQAEAKKSSVQATVKDVYVVKFPVEAGTELIEGSNIEKQKIQTGLATEDIINPVGAKTRIDLPMGAIVTTSMLLNEEEIADDIRFVEYNMITLPSTLDIGNVIDIRMTMPSGQDYIVISKKEVMTSSGHTIGINLTEDEILTMNGAIVDSYQMTASNIYAVQYVDSWIQEKAIPTYVVSQNIFNLIQANPNVVKEAKEALKARRDGNDGKIRNDYINPELNKYSEDSLMNIEEGIKAQIEKAKEAREEYLSGLVAY